MGLGNEKISIQNAVETPFWMAVWAAEPERMVDVRMSYSDLKVICGLIGKERKARGGEPESEVWNGDIKLHDNC